MLTNISAMSPAFTAKPESKTQTKPNHEMIQLYSGPDHDLYVTPGSTMALVSDDSASDNEPMGSLAGLTPINLQEVVTNHLASLKEKAVSFLGGK